MGIDEKDVVYVCRNEGVVEDQGREMEGCFFGSAYSRAGFPFFPFFEMERKRRSQPFELVFIIVIIFVSLYNCILLAFVFKGDHG